MPWTLVFNPMSCLHDLQKLSQGVLQLQALRFCLQFIWVCPLQQHHTS